MNTDITSILNHLAEVDWKAESEDVLYAVRESYKAIYPSLLEKRLDELAENYTAEPAEDFINALGQELSTLNLLLYEIDADSDSFVLTVIPTESEDELKGFLKQQKEKGILKKQPRRQIGSAAKRIDSGKRLSCEKFSLSEGYRPNLVTECSADTLWLDYHQFGASRRFDAATLDIGTWPPKQGQDLELCLSRRKP